MLNNSPDHYRTNPADWSAAALLAVDPEIRISVKGFLLGAALATYAAAALFIYILRDTPWVGLTLANVVFCLLLVLLTPSKARWLFLVYPIIISILGNLYPTPFTEVGDGPAYESVVQQYFDTFTGTFYWNSWVFQDQILTTFKNGSFGILPFYFLPEYLFSSPLPTDYFLWQSVWHVGLVALAATLARLWGVLEPRHFLPIFLFAIIGPSFLDLLSAPTRHVLTFFGVLLFFISYLAVRRSVSPVRVAGLGLAVVIILISKAPLMLPAFLFVLVDLTFIDRRLSKFRLILIGGALVLGFALLGGYLLTQTRNYMTGIAMDDVGSMGFLTKIPVIGLLAKFVFALLAPFPWSKASFFVETLYGGNWLAFLAHVGSSLFGVYFFVILALRWRMIVAHPNIEFRQTVAFGAIMSLSIIAGATSFHVYLLIYFPFFAVLLAYPRLGVHPLIPVIGVGMIELTMAIAGLR